MTPEQSLRTQPVQFSAAMDDGDCEAAPVPALWSQARSDLDLAASPVERFWLPISLLILAAWAGVTYVLFATFGWPVLLAVTGVVLAGVSGAILLVKTGQRGSEGYSIATPEVEPDEEQELSRAA